VPKALIIEFHRYHDEVLPSWSRAFHDIGWEAHVVTRKTNWTKDAFAWTERPDKRLVFQPWQRFLLKKGMPNLFFFGYDAVVFNSVEPPFLLEVAKRFRGRVLAVVHNAHLVASDPTYAEAARSKVSFFALADFIAKGFLGGPARTLFPYQLSSRPARPQPGTVRFCVQGNFEYGRRNYPSLLQVLQRFKDEGLKNFEVVFVGNVNPRDLEKFQKAGTEYGVLDELRFVNGGLAYADYFERITSCHYLLPLVEPDVPALEAYYRDSASSSLSMAIGLGVVPVMDRSLAQLYGLSDIALTYSPAETLYAAMRLALELTERDRLERVQALGRLKETRLAQNAANLKTALEG
jgi:hypothetical protein